MHLYEAISIQYKEVYGPYMHAQTYFEICIQTHMHAKYILIIIITITKNAHNTKT